MALAGAPSLVSIPESRSDWFIDRPSAHDTHSHRIRRTLIQSKTRFQSAILADTYSFGRCLILDGEIQSAQADEFIYHECLVQPAMVLRPGVHDVLVLGGGEGATVREILRHAGVRRVTMVDLDGDVVRFCQDHLKGWHRGALQHRKTRLVIEDARRFIEQSQEHFDVVISDLPTPPRGSPLESLYSAVFFRKIRGRLKAGGILVVQSGSGNPLQFQFHARVAATLRGVFPVVRPYYAYVPSFDEPWSYLLCSLKADPLRLSAGLVDRRLGRAADRLKYYDGMTHEGLFRIPKYQRALLAPGKLTRKEK